MNVDFIIKLLLTALGVGLFAFIDKARLGVIIVSCACGAGTFVISEILLHFYGNGFVMYFLSASFVCICAESGARIMRVPTTVILLPAIIPLVPGSLLYGAMAALMRGDKNWYEAYGREALNATAGIGIAIVLIAALARPVYSVGMDMVKKRKRNTIHR